MLFFVNLGLEYFDRKLWTMPLKRRRGRTAALWSQHEFDFLIREIRLLNHTYHFVGNINRSAR